MLKRFRTRHIKCSDYERYTDQQMVKRYIPVLVFGMDDQVVGIREVLGDVADGENVAALLRPVRAQEQASAAEGLFGDFQLEEADAIDAAAEWYGGASVLRGHTGKEVGERDRSAAQNVGLCRRLHGLSHRH